MNSKRGEIYLVDWSPGRGSEQAGIRPALVIQNDVGNKLSPTVIVATISTKVKAAYPFHVIIEPEESGLSETSIIKLEQIMTIDKARLVMRLGSLSDNKMAAVELAIHRSLGLGT
ncbi:MAG: type II toxin-antitoxin system PemK/MazF family toxin [Peptococcaceae bacterium]|nr:type II toxin-antitoxin system PemK/MazF family toxin [Peptococcaceae bacterium]